MTTKIQTIKARRMWLEDGHSVSGHPNLVSSKPVLVLDGSPEAYERMIAQITVALMQADSLDHREDACIALAALGLSPLRAGKGVKK